MARKEKIVVALDIGSTKVTTVIASQGKNGLEVIGLGVAESRGLKKGTIVSLEAAVETIRKSVSEAEKMATCEVDQVWVGMSGSHIKSTNSKGVTPVASRSREITQDDVRRVIETARVGAIAPDREVIHILPQEFSVDDQEGIGDPIGMIGTRLEVNVHIVTASATASQNIVTAVNRSGIEVADTVLEPLAAAEGMLSEDEKELGAILVDIGGGKTNMAIYHRGAIRHTVVVPIGGEHFTNDIAVGLRVPIPEAERLKRNHGCAWSALADKEAVFEVNGAGFKQHRLVSEQVLSDILQPRAEEIIHFVRGEMRNAGYERQTGAGIVLTGGGALLRSLPELTEEILDLPVRVGRPMGLSDSRLEAPEYATAIGLVLYAERRRKAHDFHDNSGFGRRLVSKVRAAFSFLT